MEELYCNISEEIFMIGSIYTSEMKNKLYGDKDMENDISVSRYSSKGPFISTCARGIDFVAPGAAITDLPKWNSKNNAICSGTSFAAPNAAGSIACLLSALKANKIQYSPAMIKMALANTAFLPKGANKLEFGNGIIQINDAFEFIKKSMNKLPQKLIFPFLLKQPKQKGIIYVQTDKNNAKPLSKDYTFHIDSTAFNRNNTKWILKCISNENKNFVSHSKIVKTNNNSFNVKIDANELKEGSINYAEIQGFDSLNPTIGPFFHLPITVICPANPNFYTDNIATINAGPATHFFSKNFQQNLLKNVLSKLLL
uniref:Peptidase S8/S53 domain-containing protein n=1 Tax=Panagrolaimus superbus TaxID=310955 RepID=A0A914Z0M1_9BILA